MMTTTVAGFALIIALSMSCLIAMRRVIECYSSLEALTLLGLFLLSVLLGALAVASGYWLEELWIEEEYEIHGFTVLRGVEGFGEHSKLHSSSLLALSLDLPLVLEFYASPEKAEQVARTITDRYELRHVISLPGHWFSPAPSGDV